MFFIGATLLFIATIGFWNIKEVISSSLKIGGLKAFFKVMETEFKQNKKLGYFLGFINTQGIATSFLPFIVLYAKETFHTDSADVGTYLIYKVTGIVLMSIFVLLGAKKIKYNLLLYSNVMLSLGMVIFTYVITDAHSIKYIFVLGGIVFSLFNISMNGLLLEISRNENRALYTGFTGAGNILPAIFPLIGGVLISQFGYPIFFGFFMVIILLSAFFIFKINCEK
jgi:MFS family permease